MIEKDIGVSRVGMIVQNIGTEVVVGSERRLIMVKGIC